MLLFICLKSLKRSVKSQCMYAFMMLPISYIKLSNKYCKTVVINNNKKIAVRAAPKFHFHDQLFGNVSDPHKNNADSDPGRQQSYICSGIWIQ